MTQRSQHKHTKQMYWYVECSCPHRWKPPSTLGRIIWSNSEICKNTKLEGTESVFNITQKLVMEHSEEISECEMPGIFITFLGEIGMSQWSSDQVGEGKSMCLCRFRSVCRTDERQSKTIKKWNEKVKRKDSGCIRLTKMQWVLMEKQLNSREKISQNFHHCLIFKKKEHPARRVQWPDHLHVNVQWRWVENEWWEMYFECRNSQELRNEILARTLDILGSWVGRDVVWQFFFPLKKENGILQPTKWCNDSKKLVIVFTSISALSRGILKQKKGKSATHSQWRFDEHRTLVPNSSFCKSVQCLRSSGELVSSIRFNRRRKGTSQSSCGQQDFDQVETGRSTTLGISSDTSDWKQDARTRSELRIAGR